MVTITPTNPAITYTTLQGSGRKAEQGKPLTRPGGNIPDRVTDPGQCTQVMMRLHLLLETTFFRNLNRANNDL